MRGIDGTTPSGQVAVKPNSKVPFIGDFLRNLAMEIAQDELNQVKFPPCGFGDVQRNREGCHHEPRY